MENSKETYEMFEKRYKLHHTCGYPFIPYELSYSSDCPQCCPEGEQWKDACKETYNNGKLCYQGGIWWDK
jgi:hypothetical protein